MTREEAIADIRDNIKPVVGGKSLDMAIEALELVTSYEGTINKLTKAISEQGNVLDEMFENIKTEIDFIPTYGAKFADGSINVHVNKKDVLQIIDKYKAESEAKNK